MSCPTCGGPSTKVIYAALPARLCQDDSCNTLFSGASRLIAALPFNGWFMAYEGHYLPALWAWLRSAP